MADSNSPFAEGYQATPLQLASTREYAKQLLMGSGQQPVHHWTQGVSNMVAALTGGLLDQKAAQQERAGMADFANAQKKDIPAGNYPAQPVGPPQGAPPVQKTSFDGGPSSAGQSQVAGGGASDADARAIAGIESGGEKDPYHAHGPVIANPHSAYYGDRAYGKYQVMGKNVGPWTKEVFGQEMSPQDFENNPQAQEAIFKAKFKNPTQWFGSGKTDGYTTGDEYRRKFAQAGGGQGGGEAMAFDGQPQQAAGVQAIAAAAGKGKMPAVPPNQRPDPSGGQTYINPQLVKPQAGYTPEQLQAVMQHPWATPEQREAAYQEMKARGQPIMMPSPTGSGTIMVDPNHPGVQQYFAAAPHFAKNKLGDIENERPITFDAQGRAIQQSPVRVNPGAPAGPPPGPQSSAAPAPAPAGSPAAPTVPAGATQASAFNAPAPAAEAPSKPVQVASNDPTAGIAATVGKPTVPPIQNVPKQVEQIGGSPQFNKFAQSNTAPPGVDPEDWAAYTGKKAFDSRQEVDTDAQKKSADFAAKKYDTLSTQAAAARKQMPNLDLGLAMMNDPNYHSGLMSGAQDVWSRFKSAVLGDKYANAPNEAFDKLMAGQVLDSMKSALGGLGQVRLAEISLLNKANANRYNTDASNRAVIEVSKRGIQSIDHLDQLGQQYASGGEVIDPIDGKTLLKENIGADGQVTPRHGLDVGYDKIARKFVLDHPSFTPEEIKHYETIFDSGRPPGEAAAAKPAAGPAKAATSLDDVQPGMSYKGHVFKGGDKTKQENWQ